MRLAELAKKYNTDKLDHGYCPYYEIHIKKPKHILEIGIYKGGSLKMWQEWFPDVEISGVDIWADAPYDLPGINCIRGNATHEGTYEGLNPDVVIDDGSHYHDQIVQAFNILWPRLPSGGWYIIEDLETQFQETWRGTMDGTAATDLILKKALPAMRGRELSELHIYEQIAFMRKR